jgi:uncharacterized phage-associated protein
MRQNKFFLKIAEICNIFIIGGEKMGINYDVFNENYRKDLRDTTKYILYYCNQKNIPDCSNKKLQKLLYYVQAWSLVFTGKKVFEADIEAWLHGPVVPDIYHEYKEFGFDPIPFDVSKYNNKTLGNQKLVDAILAEYVIYDAEYLEYRTHIEDPWRETRLRGEKIITCDAMKNYYKDVFDKTADKETIDYFNNLVNNI